MIFLKLATIILCMGLFWIGGHSFKMARRAIMPVILAGVCAYLTWTWWVFLAMGLGLQFMGLGYGEDSPLYKILGSWLARGVWCALVATGAIAGLVIGSKVPILLALPYLATNFAIGAVLCKKEAPDWLIDSAIGAGIGSIVLFI